MKTQPDNKVNEAWTKIVEAVWSDTTGELIKRLRTDPRAVFRTYGVEIPPDFQVGILENVPHRVHFVVPAKPGSFGNISDKDIVELYQACPGTQLDFAGGR